MAGWWQSACLNRECGTRLLLEVLFFFLEVLSAIYMLPGCTAAVLYPRQVLISPIRLRWRHLQGHETNQLVRKEMLDPGYLYLEQVSDSIEKNVG